MTKQQFFPKIAFLLCITLFGFFPVIAHGQVMPPSTTLNEDTVWGGGESYIIDSTVVVPEGVTLTIEAGTTVLITHEGSILVSGGTLLAHGEQDREIIVAGFSSDSDVLPNGAPTRLGQQLFSALYSVNGGSISVSNATVSHCYAGFRTDETGILTIDQVTFRDCREGVYASGGTVSVANSVFDNTQPYIHLDTVFTHTNNQFTNGIEGWNIAGTAITKDVTLSGGDGAYQFLSLVSIPAGRTVTIQQGAVLRFSGISAIFDIWGTLHINGAPSLPVTITSIHDCTMYIPPFRLFDQGTASAVHTSFAFLCGGFNGAGQHVVFGEGNHVAGDVSQFFVGVIVDNNTTTPPGPNPNPYPSPDPDTDPDPVPAPQRTPVLLIPGITGTTLLKGYGSFLQLWPAVANIVFSLFDEQLRELALLPDGTEDVRFPVVLGDIIRSITTFGTQSDTFAGLISTLQSQGYVEGTDLFVFPYDWRLDITRIAVSLQQRISEIQIQTGAPKIAVIAHSMGGLVTKKYSKDFGDSALEKIIFIGVPHLGAPMAAKALLYGDDLGLRLGLSLLNQKTIQYISGHMYSMYQLLPSARYVAMVGNYLHNITETFLHENVGITLHDSIDAMSFDTVPVFSIASCDSATVSGVARRLPFAVPTLGLLDRFDVRLLYTMRGDGTVPLASATAIAGTTVSQYFNDTARHSEMPSNAAIAQGVASILAGQIPAEQQHFSSADTICGGTGVAIETVGLAMSAIDQSGAYTGVTDTGSVVYADPAIAYSVVESSQQAFMVLPDTNEYLVTYRLLAGETHVIAVDTISADGTLATQQYFDIPPLPDTAVFQSWVRGGAYSPTISIDKDGDGVFEDTILPVDPNAETVTAVIPPTNEPTMISKETPNVSSEVVGAVGASATVSEIRPQQNMVSTSVANSESTVVKKSAVKAVAIVLDDTARSAPEKELPAIEHKVAQKWWQNLWQRIVSVIQHTIGTITHDIAILLQ